MLTGNAIDKADVLLKVPPDDLNHLRCARGMANLPQNRGLRALEGLMACLVQSCNLEGKRKGGGNRMLKAKEENQGQASESKDISRSAGHRGFSILRIRAIECHVPIGCFVPAVVPDDLGGADSVFSERGSGGGALSTKGSSHWATLICNGQRSGSAFQQPVFPEATFRPSPNKGLREEPLPDSVDWRRRDEQSMAE